MTEQKASTGTPEQPINPITEFDPEDEYRPEPEPEPQPPSWMDGSVRIGIHTSIAGSYLNALEAARKLGCNALQIFSASPKMWQSGCCKRGRFRHSTMRSCARWRWERIFWWCIPGRAVSRRRRRQFPRLWSR